MTDIQRKEKSLQAAQLQRNPLLQEVLDEASKGALAELLQAVPGSLAATGPHAMLLAVDAIKGKIASIVNDAKFLKGNELDV